MVDQEKKTKESNIEDIITDDIINVKDIEKKDDLTTLFAVRTTINQESNILKQIFYRFSILDVIPDIKSMLVSSLLPGYVFFEAPQKRSVQIAVQGIPHIKGRIVQNIKLKELKHVLLPRSVTEFISIGDIVEIISGVFEGARALVMRMPHDTSSSEEVVVRLLQEETPITIKIHGDYLKLVEKKRKAIEPVQKIKITDGVITDIDKAISFDEEIETEFDEEYPELEEGVKVKEFAEEEDKIDDEDDEWAKFDGF